MVKTEQEAVMNSLGTLETTNDGIYRRREDNEDDNSTKNATAQKPTKKHAHPKSGSGFTSVEPLVQDVLLGRGKPIQSHPGNQHMLSLIHLHREEYDSINRADKFRIIEDIIKRVKARGGRFMEHVESEKNWEEVPHSAAYNKVSHAFRSLRRSNLPSDKLKDEKANKAPRLMTDVAPMGNGVGPRIFPPYMRDTLVGQENSTFPTKINPPEMAIPRVFSMARKHAPVNLQHAHWEQQHVTAPSSNPVFPDGEDDAKNVCAV